MRGCNEARPHRNWGEQGFQLQRPYGRERENPRSERSEPAALKVQLGEVLPFNSLESFVIVLRIMFGSLDGPHHYSSGRKHLKGTF